MRNADSRSKGAEIFGGKTFVLVQDLRLHPAKKIRRALEGLPYFWQSYKSANRFARCSMRRRSNRTRSVCNACAISSPLCPTYTARPDIPATRVKQTLPGPAQKHPLGCR